MERVPVAERVQREALRLVDVINCTIRDRLELRALPRSGAAHLAQVN
jgi:hypothetical protein